MLAIPDPAHFAGGHPGVVVDVSPRASRRLRVAHVLSRATARRFFDIAVWLDRRRLLSPRQMMFLAGLLDWLTVTMRPRRGTHTRRVRFTGFEAEWVWHRATADPDSVPDAAIVYMHGGGLVSCGLNSHRRLVSRIARAAGVPVFNVGYRQMPHAHVTDSVDDCVHAYRYLLDKGFRGGRIIVAGDSAGGGLAFSAVFAARRQGLPLPGGIAVIAPWADYDSTLRRAHPNDRTDPFLSAAALALPAQWGIAVNGEIDSAWSPINDIFTGLPPVFIQVGSTEVLMSDAERLAHKCADAGVPVLVQIWDRGIHVFQAWADVLPDARDAIREIGRFIRDALDASDGAPHEERGWAGETPA